MALFGHQVLIKLFAELREVVGAGYSGAARQTYFAGIPAAFLGALAVQNEPLNQLLSDLRALNESNDVIGNDTPLAVWLRNCMALHVSHRLAAELQSFLDQARRPAPAAGGDEQADAILKAARDRFGLPLLDREGLRPKLTDLLSGKTRVLSVKGERLSGKSYSSQFISHAAFSRGIQILSVDAREFALDVYMPQHLVEDLAAPLGIDTSGLPPQDAQKARWVKELTNWIVARLAPYRESHWIVLDHFDEEIVDPHARLLIEHLARQAEEGHLPPVILLGYERPDKIEVLRRTVPRDEIAAIGKTEVEKHYGALFADNGNPAPPESVDVAVKKVFDLLPAEWNIEALSRAVEKVDRLLLDA
jgi:hypothetical protein